MSELSVDGPLPAIPTPQTTASDAPPTGRGMTREEIRVVSASAMGTAFEWYDFFLFGALAPVIGAKFFGDFNQTTQGIFALLTFAAGFVVRPFGGLLFARYGDLLGRKSIFLITLLVMGLSTVLVGVLPTSAQIGLAAPIILLLLRVGQGLALSGEYGGAIIYVAEHAPAARRGFYTGWIPATVGFSVFLSLGVLFCVELAVGKEAFNDWGWRLPFILSIIPLGISMWIRLKLHESPAFLKMKAEGKQSKAPIKETYGRWRNLRLALIRLFGIVIPTGMIGYVSNFYTLTLLTTVLKVDGLTANALFMITMLSATFMCVFFSWLSDKIGRKPIILVAMVAAILSYFPIYSGIIRLSNPDIAHAQASVVVKLHANPANCSFQFNPAGTAQFTSDCDKAKLALAKYSAAYSNVALQPSEATWIEVAARRVEAGPGLEKALSAALLQAGYPAPGASHAVAITSPTDLFSGQVLALLGLLMLLVMFAQMTQGPMASVMVELFPTRIRYTGMTLPYQIGNGWFGGLLPASMVAINAEAGNIYAGLWYPVIMIGLGLVITFIALPETRNRDLDSETDDL